MWLKESSAPEGVWVAPTESRMIRKELVSGVVGLLLLLSGPVLLSRMLVNTGLLILSDELTPQKDRTFGVYRYYDLPRDDLGTASALRTLRWAVALDNGSLPARWGLGRVALAVGDVETAANTLRPLIVQAEHNPLLYEDMLRTFSYGGAHEDVIALYERMPPPRRTRALSDTVALAYLDSGDEDAWDKIATLRPGDLGANYHLWVRAQQAGDAQAIATYREMLKYFSFEALDPTDDRLLRYAIEVIPELLESGLWDREKTLNVISYLIWQHHTSESVVHLLEDLMARYPNEPSWPFYLAEFYHRQERFDRAKAVYRQVLDMDSSYAQVYLRLGMVSEAAGEPLSEAARWYAQYSALAPDDLLGLRHVTETCTVLEETGAEMGDCQEAALHFSRSVLPVSSSESPLVPGETAAGSPISSPAVVLQTVLNERTDDRVIVADLGPNLVGNGGFEAWTDETPKGWAWSAMFDKAPFQSASFFGGAEDLFAYGGDRAVRVQGVWVGSQEEKSPARAGFWYRSGSTYATSITITKSAPYAVIFDYSTVGDVGGNATIWLTGEEDLLWLGDHHLSATGGRWQHFVAVGWNLSETEAEIRPLIRLFAPGAFLVDNLYVSRISLANPEAVEKSEMKFLIGTR